MKELILQDIDAYNQGYRAWNSWTKTFYTDDIEANYLGEAIRLDDYQDSMEEQAENMQKVRINNILISEDWAAIHYWTVTTEEDGTQSAANHMQFLHFVEDGDELKVDLFYAK